MPVMTESNAPIASGDDHLQKSIIAIHRSLLPQPVRHGRLQVDLRYMPYGAIGGDYCQVRFVDRDICYITMCDVVGHDIQAALLATRVSSEVRHWIFEGRTPRDMVQLLNAFIFDDFSKLGMFLSFIVARIDLRKGLVAWSGAGHPSPILLRRDSAQIEFLPSQNTLIGVLEDCLDTEPEHVALVNPGDRLVFYTDGLSETRDFNGKQLDIDGLAELAAQAMRVDLFDMADRILAGVNQHQHGPPEDDRTLIVAEIKDKVQD